MCGDTQVVCGRRGHIARGIQTTGGGGGGGGIQAVRKRQQTEAEATPES